MSEAITVKGLSGMSETVSMVQMLHDGLNNSRFRSTQDMCHGGSDDEVVMRRLQRALWSLTWAKNTNKMIQDSSVEKAALAEHAAVEASACALAREALEKLQAAANEKASEVIPKRNEMDARLAELKAEEERVLKRLAELRSEIGSITKSLQEVNQMPWKQEIQAAEARVVASEGAHQGALCEVSLLEAVNGYFNALTIDVTKASSDAIVEQVRFCTEEMNERLGDMATNTEGKHGLETAQIASLWIERLNALRVRGQLLTQPVKAAIEAAKNTCLKCMEAGLKKSLVDGDQMEDSTIACLTNQISQPTRINRQPLGIFKWGDNVVPDDDIRSASNVTVFASAFRNESHLDGLSKREEQKRVEESTEQKRVEESMEDDPAAEKRVSAAPNDRIDDDYRL